jgi:hypothetical protein
VEAEYGFEIFHLFMGDCRFFTASPQKLSYLSQKLYLKAEQQPKVRFYVLYDRIYRRNVLTSAYH